GKTGFAVVNKNAIGIADHSVLVQEEPERNGAAFGVAPDPAQNAVPGDEIIASQFGFVPAVGTVGVDQGGVGFGFDDKVLAANRLGRLDQITQSQNAQANQDATHGVSPWQPLRINEMMWMLYRLQAISATLSHPVNDHKGCFGRTFD